MTSRCYPEYSDSVKEVMDMVAQNRTLKVYGSNVGYNRVLISAHSKAEVMRIIDISRYEFDNYWAETANKENIELAMKHPLQLLVSSNRGYNNPWYRARYSTERPYDKGEEPVSEA